MDKQENRWEIKRIGLVNFWWYDEEIFEFSDGRMILRGTNGSGKSVTMQSFIPLLLDGKKSPERLDPFGNKSRRIEDYVLGYGSKMKEENTSYLFMEFGKKETQNHISIGIGLRARKGQSVKFWGFVINDGRRIGKDFYLYKELEQKIPLTKQELKNRIGEGGQVVETQKEYMELVNNTIFGFASLEEYEEFIKLLIEIRSPKLSDGKNFKPSIITEIISNSLRALSDDDLRPVAESIQNMNDTKEQLERLRNSYSAIEKLKNYYRTYNEVVLYEKAKNYNSTNVFMRKEQETEKKLRTQMENEKKELESCIREKEDTEIQIESNNFALEELRKDERFNLQKELEELKQNLSIQQKELMNEESKIERKKQEEVKQGYIQKEKLQEKESVIDEFKKKEEETSQKAKQVQYDEYFFRMDEIKENLEKVYQYDSLNNDITRYIQKIENGRDAIKDAKSAEKEYDNSLQELDRKRKEESEKAQDITKDRLLLEEEKQNFVEKMYKWESENTLLKMGIEEKAEIAQKVNEYGENFGFDNVLEAVRKPYDNIKNDLASNSVSFKVQKEKAEEEKEILLEEIEEWKNQKEAEPLRSDVVQSNRKRLKEKNIPFIPFYEVVDFKKTLEEEEKNVLENALQEMGILDALIIEGDSIDDIEKEDKEFIDRYLLPSKPQFGHSLLELFDVVIPENCKVKADTISNILSNILLDKTVEGTYVDKYGNYRIGLLGGRADKLEKAKYIGKEAKKRYKECKIQELQEQVFDKEKLIENLEVKMQEIVNKMEILKEEWAKFPSKDSLEEKLNKISIDTNMIVAIKNDIVIKEKELQTKFENLKQAKERVNAETQGIYFNKTLEVFEENLEISKDLKDDLRDVQIMQNNIVNLSNTIKIIDDNISQLRQDIDDMQYNINTINRKNKTLEEKIKSTEEMLGTGFEELQEKMHICMERAEELPKKLSKIYEKIGELNSNNKSSEDKLIALEESVKELESKNKIFKEILEQELGLKYVINEYSELGEITHKILSDFHKFDEKNKGILEYYQILADKFRENYEYLVEYNLTMEEMYFKDTSEETRRYIRRYKECL